MNRSMTMLCAAAASLAASLVLAAPRPARPAGNVQQPAAKTAVASVQDLAFMAGHWTGQVDTAQIEQTCAAPDHGFMMCMFRLAEQGKTELLELYALQEKDGTVEMRVRHFTPELGEERMPAPFSYRVTSISPTQVVLENPAGSYPKRATIERSGPDEMVVRTELVDAAGKSSFLVAHWTRVR